MQLYGDFVFGVVKEICEVGVEVEERTGEEGVNFPGVAVGGELLEVSGSRGVADLAALAGIEEAVAVGESMGSGLRSYRS